ncbi:MAG: SGNH/GDSL hydrolase family protein [Anaerolineaceae bacterium]|nr:SGNH/GDSL hydrolase family protein [Anaerolineaceae bacterium]
MSEEKTAETRSTGKFIRNVLIKGLLLFIIINFAVGLIPVGNSLGKLSLYNLIWPGRVRLPFGENPTEAYNLSLYDLEAMFASHEINAGEKPADEFRIILIGDSATWGTLLEPQDTLSGLINADGLTASDGRTVRAYNLAYPSMSLAKDLMILEKALTYDPDLILWPVTLQSFPNQIQVETPLVANNPQRVIPLIDAFDLPLQDNLAAFTQSTYWDRTLIGRRRTIFDALQLQFYGMMWAATGIDQTYPGNYTPAQRDFEADDTAFAGWDSGTLPTDQLLTAALSAGTTLAGDVPVLIVNEPILISTGANSDVRYNFFYPRWAYDQYRELLTTLSAEAGWTYIDLWDVVPEAEFTNSAVHLTPAGSQVFYNALKPALEQWMTP